jgi:hypothetical protein
MRQTPCIVGLWPTAFYSTERVRMGPVMVSSGHCSKSTLKRRGKMKLGRILAAASAIVALASSMALATPTAQTWIPSTDAKGFKEVTINLSNTARFSSAKDAGANSFDVGVVAGVLPFEAVKLEVGVDYLTTGTHNFLGFDDHPFFFNAKLATAEDLGVKGMPAFAVGIYNVGTYDKPELAASTRQNLAYGLVAKTLPVIGRISAGGYYGAKRALYTNGNPVNTDMNSGVMVSWDRTISEISDKLWAGVDYMSGNNANGEISFGVSWAFSKQITLLTGVQVFNPFYKTSAGDYNGTPNQIPGGKPAFTTQLFINLP